MGSFNLDTLVLDDKISESGVWVDFYQGSRLKVASSDSRRYKSALSREARKHRIEMDDSNPENYDIVMKVTCKVQAEQILLDWEGIDFQGKADVPYTPEMGMLALLSSPKLRDFVTEKSGEVDIFKAKTADAVKKAVKWQLTWGTEGMDALRIYQKRTGKLPPALENRPTSKTDVDFYLDCFYRLSASRGRSDSGPQPLQISEMAFYANLLGYTDVDDLLFFMDILQEADQQYLEVVRDKMEAQRQQAQNKSRNTARSR